MYVGILSTISCGMILLYGIVSVYREEKEGGDTQ